MASREKKPLAPSKAKQKANNDCSLSPNEIKSRKGKSLSNLKQQQFARNILEAVATGSQLPPKLEASLPRKKVLRGLKCKQKLSVAKANLIKSKVTRKVARGNLCRITTDIKKGVKARRVKLSEVSGVKTSRIENHLNDSEGAEASNKSAKNNLRTKKTKLIPKIEVENEDIQDKDTDSIVGSSIKSSPKLTRKSRNLDSTESLTKGVRSTKLTGFKRNCIKSLEGDIKCTKGRKSNSKDVDYSNPRTSTPDTKFSKSLLDAKSSIDLTIDEVITSMLSDSEVDSQPGITEKVEGKHKRSKKMLVEDTTVADIEIKKEPDCEDIKITSDSENLESESFQSAIQLRKRTSISQRSLRNGKLRQSDSGVSTDLEHKRRRILNADELNDLEISAILRFDITDGNADTESSFSESSGNDSQSVITIKDEPSLKNLEDGSQTGSETENNNNSDQSDRPNELGPTLRSKTKAKSTEIEIKNDSIKVEYAKMVPKAAELQDELKKSSNLEHVRKDNILAKFSDKSKGRRSSLNMDMKKTVSPFYGTEKSDGNPKSQIDQMIENIKLKIAKSIENKIFGSEKNHRLSKNFEVPKTEEIIAPLSAESQKLGLEENTEEEKTAVSKNEIKSDKSENSIPKVADTAKEIEKLVMGDTKPVETHSQNTQENESSDNDTSNSPRDVAEVVHSTENVENKLVDQEQSPENSKSSEEPTRSTESPTNEESKSPDDSKKISTRKSSRITDKNSSESSEAPKKSSKLGNKVQSSENLESQDTSKPASEQPVSNDDSLKNETLEGPAELIESKQTQEDSAKIEIQIVETAKDENEAAANLGTASEGEDAVETVSKDEERLIKKLQSDNRLISDKRDTEKQESSVENSSEFSASSGSSNTVTNNDKEEAIIADTEQADTTNSTETKKEVESVKEVEVTASEDAQSSRTDEGNGEASVTSAFKLVSKEDTVPDCNSSDVNESPKNDQTVTTGDDQTVNDIEETKTTSSGNNVEHGKKTSKEETEKSDGSMGEQKPAGEDKKRVLRARDRSKKLEKGQLSCSRERIDAVAKVKAEEESGEKSQHSCNVTEEGLPEEKTDATGNTDETEDAQNVPESDGNDLERQARTRRSREFRKRKEDQLVALKNKRPKREIRKSEQQNKEETLLDNEVAKINENNQSCLGKYPNGPECTGKFRGFSEGGRGSLEQCKENTDNARSKSENDLVIDKETGKTTENRLSRNLSENQMTKQPENLDMIENDCKPLKIAETLQKDSDETSTSGESSSSVNVTPKILETPEDKAKKESILRMLGLESLEKAAERLNNQKARKEQYTGTLKTVIRVQKEKEKERRRPRSPLKMVLKQGRGDGDGDSPENFYTIQKEFGTSGWGDSSSGANRKFSTNHRHSCDEDNEDNASKDRQSLVIPEKSSSFSIHPGRLCADVCCYCFGKFGSLDTPMHLAQMKSDERRKKILNIERHLTKDSCLCDACYRHVDRKANTSPTNMQTKPPKQHRQLMVPKCCARDCRDAARHHVKRRWLFKIKAGLQKQVDVDWESSQHTSLPFCVGHYSKIERFLICALCKRRLARNHTHQLANAETNELNHLLGQQRIPVLLAAGTFVCKLCRYFTQLQLKYKDVENMNTNHRSFYKSYRKRILHYHDIEVLDNEDEESPQSQSKDKEKRKKSGKCPTQPKNGSSKSPDGTANSASEKSTPEPSKNEGTNSETDNENRVAKTVSNEEPVATDVQYLGIENTVEKLKKRKMLDMPSYASSTPIPCDSPNEVVEILAMDKEVTLTRLPKRQRTNNDITPVVQRLGANPSISVRTLFPGEEEMNLHANIEFTNVREITPQGWEKCATMIQYDRDTKLLWQELQRPYGNQSSFLRHLILLEKYYRSGDLVLAPNASRNAINYSTSVQNRLISYEGPEKMDEPIMEPIHTEYSNCRRMSGGYLVERDRHSLPSTSATKGSSSTAQSAKASPPRVLKLNPGVSIIKKPPPNLQRLSLPSTSATANGNAKRKDGQKIPVSAGGKVFQLSEPDFKRLQTLKKQKQMLAEKQAVTGGSGSSSSPPNIKSNAQYQKTTQMAHTQFQKHLKMQQEMLNRQSRGDFEPLICDIRSLANENSPTQNLLHNLNLPKSIQVTTKTSNHVPILPKIPKSLTVIPQTVTKPAEK